MEAVALGTLADVESALHSPSPLEERDWWSRTAWLIALLAGEIAKAQLLERHGADPHARGRCGRPPLFYAIQAHRPDVLQWLIGRGQDVEQVDEFAATPLMEAVELDDLECVDILLNAGADPDVNANGTALHRVESRVIALRLLAAGADPAQLTYEGQRLLLGLPPAEGASFPPLPPDAYKAGFMRTFGVSNPQRMDVPFWNAMIRCGASAYGAREAFGDLKVRHATPVWCAQRFGQSLTLMPDGRAIQVGGEHEDWYDPDFCIYNDVFVHHPDGRIEVFGYPEDVFPPTDFHTATLLDGFIYIIGSLGYAGRRSFGATPVFRLDTQTFRIEPMGTSGEAPGWIYGHRAMATSSRAIHVWGGKILTHDGSEEAETSNDQSFILDLHGLTWKRAPRS